MAKRKVFGLFYVKEGVINGSIINFISIKYEGEGRRNLEEDTTESGFNYLLFL